MKVRFRTDLAVSFAAVLLIASCGARDDGPALEAFLRTNKTWLAMCVLSGPPSSQSPVVAGDLEARIAPLKLGQLPDLGMATADYWVGVFLPDGQNRAFTSRDEEVAIGSLARRVCGRRADWTVAPGADKVRLDWTPKNPDAYLGVPLKMIEGLDVNCVIGADTPSISTTSQAGNEVHASISRFRCPSEPPTLESSFTLHVELFQCRDLKDLRLTSLDGLTGYKRMSINEASSPLGMHPERAIEASFLLPPQPRGRVLSFQLVSKSPNCRATVTIPPTHILALDAWERDVYRQFQLLNSDFGRQTTP